jgi:hypothetical protein
VRRAEALELPGPYGIHAWCSSYGIHTTALRQTFSHLVYSSKATPFGKLNYERFVPIDGARKNSVSLCVAPQAAMDCTLKQADSTERGGREAERRASPCALYNAHDAGRQAGGRAGEELKFADVSTQPRQEAS